MSRGCESLSLLIYAAFQQHICINLPETSLQASRCHALRFPIHHHHPHLLPPNHQQSDYRCEPWGDRTDLHPYESAYVLLSVLNFEMSMCGIRKKIIILRKGKILKQKESVSRMFSGLAVVLGNFWKMASPQATRRLLIPKCCGLHFHILSLAVYFLFTRLPSVLVYTI